MPVPTSIADLRKVAAENSPQGTETVRSTIDDYFRAHASFIRQLFDQLLGPSVTLPSAATVNIGFAGAVNIVITGTTQINAFDVADEGTTRWITFTGALTLKYSAASMQLPGAADIVTRAGDVAVFKSLDNGNWKCMAYQRISGTGPVAASMLTDGYLTTGDWNSFNSRMTPAAVAAAYVPRTGGDFTGSIGAPGLYAKRGNAEYEGGKLHLNRAFDDAPSHFWQAYGNDTLPIIRLVTPLGAVVTISSAGDIVAKTGAFTSDERLKKRWRRRPADFLERIAGLMVGDFLWKKDGTPGIGTPAQKLEAIWPEAVHTDERGYKSVNYGAAAFVIAVELARAFFAHVTKTDKRLAKLEGK